MRLEVETRVMLPQAKGCQQPPEAGRETWTGFSCTASRGSQACPRFEFRLLASRAVGEQISVALSHPTGWWSFVTAATGHSRTGEHAAYTSALHIILRPLPVQGTRPRYLNSLESSGLPFHRYCADTFGRLGGWILRVSPGNQLDAVCLYLRLHDFFIFV